MTSETECFELQKGAREREVPPSAEVVAHKKSNAVKSTPTSFRLKTETVAALKEFAGTHNPMGLSRTQIVEAALVEYIKHHS
ncbi:hypothetical protein BMYO_1999 [Bifidobacterium myosotis]|uniref:Uncharacterized protein n=1 Tax=Bifidobacterium myosotis TaxID=1630166 RepID=A0A261FEH1_9BIFI|nr:hypothetical protein [Bifidobacterium myosotis]OZG57266.1 hypothetical protein BMYO_1999 [Bifidobacterium myosotis]